MKTGTIIFFVGSVIIIGGGTLVFMLVTKPAVDTLPALINVATTTTTIEKDTTTGSASIQSLMTGANDKNIECTFVFTGTGMRSEGTGFFIDGKARVDTLYSDNASKQIASYLIIDTPADTMYLWSLVGDEQTGVKMLISDNEKMATKLSANNPEVIPQQITPDSNVQYTCRPWSPDLTVFIPPTDVEFTDIGEMMGE
jgi:hypothetical protein